MFAIEDYAKGYFPHFFQYPENYDYSGPLPGKEFYGPDHMSAVEREKFMQDDDEDYQDYQNEDPYSSDESFGKWECEIYADCTTDTELKNQMTLAKAPESASPLPKFICDVSYTLFPHFTLAYDHLCRCRTVLPKQ
ncbi:hypothetical protein U1Q18_042360 [Sarracenia purpurea var. burkii]